MASLKEYLNSKIKSKGSTLAKEKAKGKKHKSIAAAKKAGALYYTNKDGKLMAAVYAEDLKKPIKKSLKPRKRPGSGLSPTTGTSGPKTRNQKARDREAAEVRKANEENRIAREQKEGSAASIKRKVEAALKEKPDNPAYNRMTAAARKALREGKLDDAKTRAAKRKAAGKSKGGMVKRKKK